MKKKKMIIGISIGVLIVVVLVGLQIQHVAKWRARGASVTLSQTLGPLAEIIGNIGNMIEGLLSNLPLFIFLCASYFLPAIIAHGKSHPQRVPIAIINAVLGFTFIAWAICLAWALSAKKEIATVRGVVSSGEAAYHKSVRDRTSAIPSAYKARPRGQQ